LIQVVQDKNNPDLEGKIMIFKFGKKLNETLEAQLKPEYGEPCNPFDLFGGKLFSVHSRKVGEWNNYDLCSFVGDKCPIEINGRKMKKTPEDMRVILEYLETGPKNLTAFDYREWDEDTTQRVMNVIKNTVPDGRLVNEILAGVNKSDSKSSGGGYSVPTASPVYQPTTNDIFEEASSTSVGKSPEPEEKTKAGIKRPSSPVSASTLDDLYADL
jgi:hypothetical protein